jgi:serine/threonine protein kinase
MNAGRWRQVREVLFAASEMRPDARTQYVQSVCMADDELRGEVERLLTALEDAGTFLEPGVLGGLPAGVKIGPYRILGEAGRGGMGVVYRAVRDDDYRQEVALKLVKRDMESGPLLIRFRQERQALALLNHPNIARLLDGGTTADGRPYLVMEWAAGEPITTYCHARSLSAPARLTLFLRVCEAVSHAHRNLVVHRDLKPSNIVVTDEGEPKLLDFGIAKIFTPASEAAPEPATLTLARILTPDYASPEQVRGDPVTTATDIYSLGAVLYEMLAGTRPHRLTTRTPAEIEQVVCTGDVPRPSSAAGPGNVSKAELCGDLDNIVLKALEKNPERRYSHVEEFAADIRNHLEGRPVLARPASPWYRASKFARRNRLAVAAAMAAALALTAGLLVALWQAQAARREREVAERRFELARQMAGSLLFEVHDQIADLAGSSQAREVLLAGSLRYLDALSKEAGSSLALQRDLARGYERVAKLQGEAGSANLGQGDAAYGSLQKALRLRRSVLATNPRSEDYRRELAATLRQFSGLRIGAQEKLQHTQAALDLVESLLTEQPDRADLRREEAICEYDVATALTELARYQEAIPYYRKALSHSSGSNPANIALYRKRLGALLVKTGDLTAGLQEYQAAAALDESRVRENPANGRAKMDLSYDYSDWGYTLRQMGNNRAALEQYRRAENIRAELAGADPRDARAANGLVSIESRIASALADSGDHKASRQTFQRAIGHAEKMIETFSDKQIGRGALAEVYYTFGKCYISAWSSCEGARPWLARARDLYLHAGNDSAIRMIDQQLASSCSK